MNTNNHHDTNSTNNAGFPPATPQATPSCSVGGANMFHVKAYRSDPTQCEDSRTLDRITVSDLCCERSDRTDASVQARYCLRCGYWVEVCSDDGELLAGPFDPDVPTPAYIV